MPTQPSQTSFPTLSMYRFFQALLAIACVAPWLVREASARTPIVTKLHPRLGDVTREGYHFGGSVAVNENWIVVGADDYGPLALTGPAEGSVFVFSARTGRLVRRIQPSRDLFGELNGNDFGRSLALCGNRLLVGAPFFIGNSPFSAALLYDLPSGRLLNVFPQETSSLLNHFGQAVALSDRWIVVGEDHDDDLGRVHVFDARTREFAFFLQAGDGFVNSGFGGSLALCGDILAVGARDETHSTSGAVYLYDLDEGGTELRKLTPSDGSAGDTFGEELSMEGGRLLVGSRGHNGGRGAAYLFEVGTGNEIRKLEIPNSEASVNFGQDVSMSGNVALISGSEAYLVNVSDGSILSEYPIPDRANPTIGTISVSLCGNLAVVGAPFDDDLNTNSGAAYFFRPLAGPLPLTTLAQRGDSVGINYPEVEYRAFQSPVIDPSGDAAFCANLSGPGSAGGRDKVITASISQSPIPRHKTRDPITFFGDGVVIQSFRPPIYNRAGRYLQHQFLRGPGINAFNRQLIRGPFGTLVLRTGDPIFALTNFSGTPEALTFTEIVQKPGDSGDSLIGVAYRLRRNVGGVDATNDSGVLLTPDDGSAPSDTEAREGNTAIFGETYAQFFGRVAQNRSAHYAYSAYVVPNGGGRPLQQCFMNNEANGNLLFNVAKQGDDAPLGFYRLSPGETATFRTILGEGMIPDQGVARARIVRAGNSSGNEGLWAAFESIPRIIKGEEFDAPGTKLQRILRFWPLEDGNIALLIKLSGPAVNPGNDCALAMLEKIPSVDFWNLKKLVREGDAVCDWDCPRIRAIQRVDVDPINGNYAAVVSLTGSPARNQALLTGDTGLAHPNPPIGSGDFTNLRRPNLVLRKGTLYNTPYAESTRLRSIVLEPRIDRTGSGGKGLGQVINENGEVVLCLQFDDGAKELVVGKP
ncbi:MAG: hypothetical protein KDN19_00600 [Verrucomicrobiae bacterium]|nr:hypothetical protein [Verrucomicrobiae bacterium]